jgi:trehalose/maltose hydrolase-like predicted phosphorylase
MSNHLIVHILLNSVQKASLGAVYLEAINNPISTENIKEQIEIKCNVLDGNVVNEGDLVKEQTEVPSKVGIFVETKQIITEKRENSEKLNEQAVLKHDETSPIESSTQDQEKVNGETENGLYSSQFSEELSPVVLKVDGLPTNGTPLLPEKNDSDKVAKEDAHQNQVHSSALCQ